jgi:DNA repair protein RadC
MQREHPSTYSVMIREMQLDERPRERLQNLGPASLSSSELLAIILNTGIKGESVTSIAQRMLSSHGGLAGLMRMEFVEMAGIRGVGRAKAAKVKAALEIGRRVSMLAEEDRPSVGTPEDIVLMLGVEMMALEQEELRVVLLDTKHHIIGTSNVYRGTVNAVTVRMADIFKPAVRHSATAMALVHNHPSGDPSPSAADVQMTREAVAAGKMLDTPVIDHVIIGHGKHVSLKRLGLGFDGG